MTKKTQILMVMAHRILNANLFFFFFSHFKESGVLRFFNVKFRVALKTCNLQSYKDWFQCEKGKTATVDDRGGFI